MKKILTKDGEICQVSDLDYDRVSKYNWNRWGRYISGWVGNKTTSIHRFIMNAKRGEIVDHIDHNTLNNTRENLRICSQSENMRNKSTAKNATHGMNGIARVKYGRMNRYRYRVRITVEGETHELGMYDDLKDAQEARIQGEIKYFGEFRKVDGAGTVTPNQDEGEEK